MNRQQRRERFPEVAKFCDDMLAVFDGAKIAHVSLPGYEWGKQGSAGVVPNVIVREKEKRK